MNLYHIRQEHLALLSDFEEQGGEIYEHQEQALGLTMEAFQEKAVSVGFMMKHYDDNLNTIDVEIARLQGLKAAAAKRQNWLKEHLSSAMVQFGVEKIDTPTLKLSFRKSEAVEVEDESLLPIECKELVPESYKVSKTKIKELIKAGQQVPGASLVTRQNLQIR